MNTDLETKDRQHLLLARYIAQFAKNLTDVLPCNSSLKDDLSPFITVITREYQSFLREQDIRIHSVY